MIDALRPYLATIRIIGYVVILAVLTISSCSYGKKLNSNSLYKAETDLAVCRDANKANLETIKTLQGINAEYARQGAQQAEKVAEVVKDAKRAQERAQAREKALNKELQDAYAKNKQWGDTAVPADYIRLLNRTR